MFRLFLRKKILSGSESGTPPGVSRPAETKRRNRRIFARYKIDHKHLMLMNEQDILQVREISAKGFSTEVSPRCAERLVHGDVYDARIRYLGEIYDLKARVAWKEGSTVGFEMVDATREAMSFVKRLLKPVEIAASLQAVDTTFMSESGNGKTWYHGDEESDLYLWHDPDTDRLSAWQLAIGREFVEWSEANGLSSGSLIRAEDKDILSGGRLAAALQSRDAAVDEGKRQFAVDVIMALPLAVREELLDTLTR
jgi:hypothetical protein